MENGTKTSGWLEVRMRCSQLIRQLPDLTTIKYILLTQRASTFTTARIFNVTDDLWVPTEICHAVVTQLNLAKRFRVVRYMRLNFQYILYKESTNICHWSRGLMTIYIVYFFRALPDPTWLTQSQHVKSSILQKVLNSFWGKRRI